MKTRILNRTWALALVGALIWLAAPAARAQSGAGLALQLDGVDDYAEAASGAASGDNYFPLTVTAWIKTSQNTAGNAGIVGKFVIDSFNGYAMVLQNGMVWAAYYRDANSYLFSGRQWLNGGFIADGAWHHVAFAVDQAGGRLYVDGTLRDSLPWTGTPGACTTTVPLQNRALRGLSGRAD